MTSLIQLPVRLELKVVERSTFDIRHLIFLFCAIVIVVHNIRLWWELELQVFNTLWP
jgi:hypothetical protein